MGELSTAAVMRLRPRTLLFLLWLGLVLFLVGHHVFWRDEVRAFSLALTGDTWWQMLRAVHGEGHPALWYLLLRAAHDLVPVREVLPATALLVGMASAALVAFRSPFRPATIALILLGGWSVFEYVVSARNYGISVLVMFVIADRYSHARSRGVTLGGLVILLCNTNAPAVLLAGAFMLFWLVDLLLTDGWRSAALRWWGVNAGLALLGVALCVVTIYPPFNDAAVSPALAASTPGKILMALAGFGAPMGMLLPEAMWPMDGAASLIALLLLGSVVGLVRSPAALLAGLVAMLSLPLFFQLVYSGNYRHQALLLAFIVMLYWIVARGPVAVLSNRWVGDDVQRVLQRLGTLSLTMLLLLQLAMTGTVVGDALRGRVLSRSRDLGALLARPDLRRAVVMANPDYLVEPLGYYANNPVYLPREQRYGSMMRFTRHLRLDLSLSDVLVDARHVQAATHRPVVIVLQRHLDPAAPPLRVRQSYNCYFSTTPAEVRQFLAATHLLARFGPATGDETYDTYLLRPARP